MKQQLARVISIMMSIESDEASLGLLNNTLFPFQSNRREFAYLVLECQGLLEIYGFHVVVDESQEAVIDISIWKEVGSSKLEIKCQFGGGVSWPLIAYFTPLPQFMGDHWVADARL